MNLTSVKKKKKTIIIQIQKDKYYSMPLSGGAWSSHSQRDRKQNGGCQGWGVRRKNGESGVKGCTVLIWEDWKVLKMHDGEAGITECTENGPLTNG